MRNEEKKEKKSQGEKKIAAAKIPQSGQIIQSTAGFRWLLCVSPVKM